MDILLKATIVIGLFGLFIYAFLTGLDREARRQEIVNRDICVKYELECRG